MENIDNLINTILGISYLAFFIYLVKHKKEVPINILGILLSVAVLYPYIILYDVFHHYQLNPHLQYEIMLCRFLVVMGMYSTTRRFTKVNRELTELSKKSINLLKPKNDK